MGGVEVGVEDWEVCNGVKEVGGGKEEAFNPTGKVEGGGELFTGGAV